MSRIHVMESSGLNNYRIVVHAPTPNGNNSAAVSWVTALANSGQGTQLPVGSGPGQISTSEANQVAAGQVIEASGSFTDDPAWNNAQRTAALVAEATKLVTEAQAELQKRLKFFGHEVA